ncbi:MAG: hypothetical protein GY948_02560 [Alphaproteobacteria bacterium]|nr:hypothetical protein [Alphaproteobacteria bacterium]
MTAIVFIGPTISEAEVLSVLDADCWSPAAQGDVYQAVQQRPRFIGLIDGYFDGVASVWHKEILWALSEGVTVLGASSMGALRAAELSAFGMTGVGQIFEGYQSGKIEDDDEVAVVHGPAELGYVPLSEPMVNIRPTLERAVASNVLSKEQSRYLCTLAKSLDYRERTWEQLLERPGANDLPKRVRQGLADWLPENSIDQKKLDAFELLETIKRGIAEGHAPLQVGFTFEQTILWQQGTASWCTRQDTSGNSRDVLDELMLSDQQFAVRQQALLRKSAVDWAFEQNIKFNAGERREVTKRFREQAGLMSGAGLARWLSANDLSAEEFKELLIEELSVSRLAENDPEMFDAHALGVLKLEGAYESLAHRALHKAEVLGRTEHETRVEAFPLDIHPTVLEEWFFQPRPNYGGFGSVEAFIAAHGLQSKDDFYTILAREYLYLQQLETDAG